MGLFPTYQKSEVHVTRGEGACLWDEQGRCYLDFTSGIGVCNLGHAHPRVKDALINQASKLWHISNLFPIQGQKEVASTLFRGTGLANAFFANSGAEANEAAIKLARRWGHQVKGVSRPEILTFYASFHGRTLATLTATGQEKVQEDCGPLPEGFAYAFYNDIASVKESVGGETVAILLEIIQGEGGIQPGEIAFLQEIEALCRERGYLLMVDEIQTGLGRTGKLFAYQEVGIQPDIVTCAKGLGNGFPVSVMLGRSGLETFLGPGSHGTTFGGNPLAMAVAGAVLQEMMETPLLAKVEEIGEYLGEKLQERLLSLSGVKAIRGRGMMWGVELDTPVAPFVKVLAEQGLLVLTAGPRVLRLLPPLIITKEQVDQAVDIIVTTWRQVEVDESLSGI
ncbi:aspartate aminotransferase family protein [Marininema halotolerans]|uniref:Acetylornithine aminotransferase n=1 Tax=Marininema halotolerans TaxID=1155944 RepID=A0A1I6NZ24_9BACL|nr:aspartate aminotransferase family protein [Marininema halotolerans]SFS33203.1 acetylornithine aminotransferase [Marininema halotolerans]